MADYPTKQFFGTPQTVISLAVDIASGNFSGAPAATFTNTDVAVPAALSALATAQFPDWGAAPLAGSTIELWGILKATDGANNDTDAPSGTTNGGAKFFGEWVLAAVDALQRRTIVISLDGIGNGITIDFYLKNNSSQNMNNDAGTSCIVKITPFSYGITI